MRLELVCCEFHLFFLILPALHSLRSHQCACFRVNNIKNNGLVYCFCLDFEVKLLINGHLNSLALVARFDRCYNNLTEILAQSILLDPDSHLIPAVEMPS